MSKKNNYSFTKILQILGLVIVIPSLVLNFFLFQKLQNNETTYLVKEVIDGDTFATENISYPLC